MGAPRVAAELNDGATEPQRVNHKRVARVMRETGIVGYVKRRRVKTTIPEPADQKVPDLVKRDFTATAPNQRYNTRQRHSWCRYQTPNTYEAAHTATLQDAA